MRSVWGRTVPGEPSRHSKRTGPSGIHAGDQPHGREDRGHRPGSSSRFLAENGSIDGGMMTSRVPVHPVRHVLRPGEHEGVGAFEVGPEERPRLIGLVVARCRARRDSATRRGPRPHGGRRPCRRSEGRAAARCRGRRPGRSSRRGWRRGPARSRRAPARPSGPPSPGSPCRRLCRRLVMAKNSGSPSSTSHRFSICAPCPYASSVWSISATPPPWAVALTCQIVRSPKARQGPHGRHRQPARPFGRQDARQQLQR